MILQTNGVMPIAAMIPIPHKHVSCLQADREQVTLFPTDTSMIDDGCKQMLQMPEFSSLAV